MCISKGINTLGGDFIVSLSYKKEKENIFNVLRIYFDHGSVYSTCTYGTQIYYISVVFWFSNVHHQL